MQAMANSPSLLATAVQCSELVGWPVWGSLAVGLIGALMTSGAKFPPTTVQLRLKVWLPVTMLTFCFLSQAGDWIGYYQRAPLDVAFIISIAFGIAFTLDALRTPHRSIRASGACNALAYALLAIAVIDIIR